MRDLSWGSEPPRTVNIGLVQGNIDQNQKWEPAFQSRTIAHYMALTEQLVEEGKKNGRKPAAVFWPETAMPFYFDLEPEKAIMLRGFAAKHGINLGFGTVSARRTRDGGTELFNRFQVIGPNGMDVGYYDKQHLVPFGEYVPFNLDLAFVSAMLQGVPFAPGRVSGPLRLPLKDYTEDAPRPENPGGPPPVIRHDPNRRDADLALGVLICYEAIFPTYAQERVKRGAEVLLNISNDAWFGRTSSPLQHLHLAALRAVEQDRPLLRVTNTGYSAFIDSAGRISEHQSDLFVDDAFTVQVPPGDGPSFWYQTKNGLTLYHHLYGYVEGFLLFAAALALFLHPATQRFRRIKPHATAL